METNTIDYKVSLALTRYLYQMIEVKQSLFIALINKNPDEALYWTYELYYSGFEEEVYEYIILIYETLYQSSNPSLENLIKEKYKKWLEIGSNSETNTDIGSIIYTLTLRPYCLIQFARTYLNVNIVPKNNTKPALPPFIVKLTPDYIQKYNIYQVDDKVKRYHLLEHAIKYPIHKKFNKLLCTITYENPLEAFRIKWLYYASFSPIWRERITQYNGTIDYQNEIVHFDNEDDEEDFRCKWDYDPDEVSVKVTQSCIGNGTEKQISVKDFCEMYNYTIKSRILKRQQK